ncbi:MAG: hypothetical protein AAGI52_06590 [Bacteroidota bacterium]
MPDDIFLSENLRQAYGNSQKFDLYMVGLIFTLLALAVESGDFGPSGWRSAAELGGWTTLLVSGFSGLSGLNRRTGIYSLSVERSKIRKQMERLVEMANRGALTYIGADPVNEEGMEIRERNILRSLQIYRIAHETCIKAIDEARNEVGWRIEVRNWGLVVGTLLLMTSRAWKPLSDLTAWIL